MKVPKDKYNVSIVCADNMFIKGIVHVTQGLRLSDFLNDKDESFVAITNAKFFNVDKSYIKLKKKGNVAILNKSLIRWMEEIE